MVKRRGTVFAQMRDGLGKAVRDPIVQMPAIASQTACAEMRRLEQRDTDPFAGQLAGGVQPGKATSNDGHVYVSSTGPVWPVAKAGACRADRT